MVKVLDPKLLHFTCVIRFRICNNIVHVKVKIVVECNVSSCGVRGRGPDQPGALLAALVLAPHLAAVQALRHGGDGSQHLLGLQVGLLLFASLTVCRQLFDQIVFWSPK